MKEAGKTERRKDRHGTEQNPPPPVGGILKEREREKGEKERPATEPLVVVVLPLVFLVYAPLLFAWDPLHFSFGFSVVFGCLPLVCYWCSVVGFLCFFRFLWFPFGFLLFSIAPSACATGSPFAFLLGHLRFSIGFPSGF